uniref:Uncharacterized protein n=1 Tax=Anguilla anguilla TaxID=7936 RepID=A0A0E9TLQ3_ANGAN
MSFLIRFCLHGWLTLFSQSWIIKKRNMFEFASANLSFEKAVHCH